MSVRGIEIHNGKVVFPEGMPQTLHMGPEASPLEQGEAGQIVISAVINATVLGGTVEAGLFEVIGSEDLTGDLRGLHAEAIVNTGVTVTGSVWGLHITQQVLGTGKVSSFWEGIRLEMSTSAGAEITGGVCGIFISNFIEGTLGATYHFIRVQENSTAP